jgi:restriction system protein
MTVIGDLITIFTRSGLQRYQIEIKHEGLKKYQLIKGDNWYYVQEKAKTIANSWDEIWNQKEKDRNNRRSAE